MFSNFASRLNNGLPNFKPLFASTSISRSPFIKLKTNFRLITFKVINEDNTKESEKGDNTQIVYLTKPDLSFLRKRQFLQSKNMFNDTSMRFFDSIAIQDFDARPLSTHMFYSGGSRLLCVGLGSVFVNNKEGAFELNEESINAYINLLRDATYAVIKEIRDRGRIRSAALKIPQFVDDKRVWLRSLDAIVRTSILSNYRFDKYISSNKKLLDGETKEINTNIERLDIDCSSRPSNITLKEVENVLKRSKTIAEGTIYARNIANEQADVANPQYFEDMALKLAEKYSDVLKVSVVDHKKLLEDEKLFMISAVGQASKQPPRLILLEYNGDTSKDIESHKQSHIALVGKGVTFDSGGLNLKPTKHIEDMHLDKSGAAGVLGAMKAIAELKIKRNVVGVLALAENCIGSRSYKPGSILSSEIGTVEVVNTDAEGRLCLADAFSYTKRHFNPRVILDIATLTRSCSLAFGEQLAGLFSNDEKIRKLMQKIGDETYERCQPLPILPEHDDELRGTVSDFRSASTNSASVGGGTSIAAAFLQKYALAGDKNSSTPSRKWIHLDIAGPGIYSKARGFMPKGGTGFGVALMVNFVDLYKFD